MHYRYFMYCKKCVIIIKHYNVFLSFQKDNDMLNLINDPDASFRDGGGGEKNEAFPPTTIYIMVQSIYTKSSYLIYEKRFIILLTFWPAY